MVSLGDEQLNCCKHDGGSTLPLRGVRHDAASCGGENLSGGLCANGTAKYLFTTAVAEATTVVVPITAPDAKVAVGRPVEWDAEGYCVGYGWPDGMPDGGPWGPPWPGPPCPGSPWPWPPYESGD